jgi:hypothetical protein
VKHARGAALALTSVLALAAACGGKIDTVGDADPSAPATTVPGRRPPSPSPTSGPTPSAPPALIAARDIADAYCTTFAGCCRSAGQPPIDIARCREVTEAVVTRRAGGATGASATDGQIKACVSAIRTRTEVCSKVDADWSLVDKNELFAPRSIADACAPLIGTGGSTKSVACGAKLPCELEQTCAIDECTSGVGSGGSCIDRPCLDGLVCGASQCGAPPGSPAGTDCMIADSCALGLVCADGECALARSHPELYVERHSPYRVGFDTCRVFSNL